MQSNGPGGPAPAPNDRIQPWEWLALVAILAVAALLRVVNLIERATWDADQGNQLLAVLAFVRDGTPPLLGPMTSVGPFHHGAFFYYMLAPVGLVTGVDPAAMTLEIALFGVAAVGLTWWLARAIGGGVAGLLAAVILATSTGAVAESTFIWNPNPIGFTSALALAAAWRAWSTGDGRWWIVAAVGTAATSQLHTLGVIIAPAVAALYVADLIHRPAEKRRPLLTIGVAAVLAGLATFLPLIVHELTTGLAESRAILAWIGSGGSETAIDPVTRFLVVGLRSVAWPLTGIPTTSWIVAIAGTAVAVALIVVRWRRASGAERTGLAWLGLTLAWSIAGLWLLASGLATIVAELPVDHYHAFLDPVVVAALGVALAGIYRRNKVGRLVTTLAVAALVGWNLANQPPMQAVDGGWPAAEQAAGRIGGTIGEGTLGLVSLPEFKNPDAYGFPLIRAGRVLATPASADASSSSATARSRRSWGAAAAASWKRLR